MKFQLKLALVTVVLTGQAFAAGATPRGTYRAELNSYIAYASGDINAACSDFLGQTGAGGQVTLRDFLIRNSLTNRCALESAGIVTMVRGSLQDPHGYSCAATARFNDENTGTVGRESYRVDHGHLLAQMQEMSRKLKTTRSGQIKKIKIGPSVSGTLELSAEAGQLLVVEVSGVSPVIKGLGVKLKKGLRPEQIVWHFADAQTVSLSNSGVNTQEAGEHLGMPGTFLAPQATFSFNDVLITGALYAGKIVGKATRQDCQGSVSGQINPAPLMPIPQDVGAE